MKTLTSAQLSELLQYVEKQTINATPSLVSLGLLEFVDDVPQLTEKGRMHVASVLRTPVQ